jgi:Ca-activated chloride channel family protein
MRRLSSLLLFCCSGWAQSKLPAPATTDEPTTFSSETRWVILPVSVSDKNGKLIMDLQQKSFKVLENGIEQPIKLFKHEDVPISLGIIVDNSGSMKEKRQKVEIAGVDLVKASNPHDEVFIVNFNDEAYLDVEFTNDIKKMEEGIARIDSRGGTAMREAISSSIDYLKEKGKNHKRVLLVVTDGNDNASTISLERLVNRARQSEVLIYAIGLLDEEERREAKSAKRALNALTQESGGLSFYPKGVADVDAIALQVAHEIRNQYTIAYSPLNDAKDGTFRQIKVVVNGPGHPQVRTRTGYYATPDTPTKKSVSSTN